MEITTSYDLSLVKPFAAGFTRIRTRTRQSWAQTQFIFTLNLGLNPKPILKP